jgi:biofilm PGA synthesis protein PgaA
LALQKNGVKTHRKTHQRKAVSDIRIHMSTRALSMSVRYLLIGACLSSAASAWADASYDALIARARNGEARAVLSELQTRLNAQRASAQNVISDATLHDLIVVANWAEAHQLAVDTFASLASPARAPAYVVGAVALSERRLGHYAQALIHYQTQLVQTPDDRTAQAGYALSLLEQEGPIAASAYIDPLIKRIDAALADKKNIPLIEALATIRERQSRWTEALAAWQAILSLSPDNASAQRALIFVASRLGAASIADDLAKKQMSGIERDARTRLRQDDTAFKIRWGEIDLRVKPRHERFAGTDVALTANASDLSNPDATRVYRDMATADRLVALRNRVAMRDVIELYSKALSDQVKLPSYATSAAADAYLYEREPERARDLYLQALQQYKKDTGGSNIEWQFSLVYAYIECEQWADATALVDTIVLATAPRAVRGTNTADNPDYARALLLRAALELYGDEHRAARQHLDEFIRLAPHSVPARSTLASWYSANGKTRLAYDAFSRVLTEDPEALEALVGKAETSLTMRRWEAADQQIAMLQREYPESRAVQRLQDDWDMLHSPEIRINAGFTQSSGDSSGTESSAPSTQSAREWQVDAYAYTSPIIEGGRLFAHLVGTRGTLVDDSRPGMQRFGVGIDYQRNGSSTSVELHRRRFTEAPNDNDVGVALSGVYAPNDEWRIRAAADSHTSDIAFRAIQSGVSARKFELGATRLFQFSRSLLMGAAHYDFSDGNRRTEVNASWRERPYSAARLKIDTDVSVGASQNSRTDVAYFSPARDQSVEGTITADWLTWRRYERSFKQFASATAGAYRQTGFGAKPVVGFRYAHEWSRSRHWGLQYGVAWLRRPYDGVQEQRTRFFAEFNWRLR